MQVYSIEEKSVNHVYNRKCMENIELSPKLIFEILYKDPDFENRSARHAQ